MYPYSLINLTTKSIFGNALKGNGLFLPLSDNSDVFDYIDIRNQNELQDFANNKMLEADTNWAISEFGEKRSFMFSELGFSQMVTEGRFYHLGVDLWLPEGTALYSPIDGEVVISMYEEGDGNYGGLVVIKHVIANEDIYSVYGHLDKEKLPKVGIQLHSGEKFAELGGMSSNGGYFYHLHLQVLTEKGYSEGFVHKGYSTEEQFKVIDKWCLNPNFLLLCK